MAWAVSPAALAASPIAVSAEGSGSTMGAGLATSEAPQRTRQLCWQRRSGLVTDLCSGLRGMLSDNGKVEALVSMPCLMVASAPSRQRVGSSLEPNEASPVDSPLQPAHSLAVQAFKHEEESAKSLKRREHLEQDKCGNDDPNPTELSRGKSVRFLFAVFYRVTIKACGEDFRQRSVCEFTIPFLGKVC